jgi:hypothetical protein
MSIEILTHLILSGIVTIPFALWVWKKAINGQWVLWYVIVLLMIWG